MYFIIFHLKEKTELNLYICFPNGLKVIRTSLKTACGCLHRQQAFSQKHLQQHDCFRTKPASFLDMTVTLHKTDVHMHHMFIPSLKLQHPQDCLCQSVSPILSWLCQGVSLGYTNLFPGHSRDSLNKNRWCELIGPSKVWELLRPDFVFVLKKLYNCILVNASDLLMTFDDMISVHFNLKNWSNIRLVGPFAGIVKCLINSRNIALQMNTEAKTSPRC